MVDNISDIPPPDEAGNVVPSDGKPSSGSKPPPFQPLIVSKPVPLQPPSVSTPVPLGPPIVSKPVPLEPPPPPATFEDFMNRFPDIQSAMIESIAVDVCDRMRKGQDRIKKMRREYERD